MVEKKIQTIYGLGTQLNSLVEKVTYMETGIKINSYRLHTISKATKTWFKPSINSPMLMLGQFNDEIKSAESMISEIHPHHWSQIHKMAKEVPNNFIEVRESQEIPKN